MYRALPNRTNTQSGSLLAESRRNPFDAGQARSILGQAIPRENVPQGSSSRIQGADLVLWMRDITVLTGVHRSTITRWINRGEFPKKDAPYSKPNGWLRSTYERWLLGAVHIGDEAAPESGSVAAITEPSDIVTRLFAMP